MNRIGQLRLYSAVDLFLLLIAARADVVQVCGDFCLWFGFLLYLESCHQHGYRSAFPKGAWAILYCVGIICNVLADGCILALVEGSGFIGFSHFYAKKKDSRFSPWAPIFRGSQSLILIGALQGYRTFFPWLALIVTVARNFLGDVRDVTKDKKEGMNTLAVKLGMKEIPHIHLVGVLGSSAVWWWFSPLSFLWLIVVWTIECVSYYWTPR